MAIHLPNEGALLSDARAGKPDAFGILIGHYYGNLYRLTLKVTGNREDAEDAVQDAVLKAYCNLGQFQGNSRFYTWLVRIALNEALMKLRRRRSDRAVPLGEVAGSEGDGGVPWELEDHGQNPERRFSEVEMWEILTRALDHLSPRLGAVLVLQSVEGFSVAEMADMLGLSAAAVKSRLLRARLELRHRLLKFFEPAAMPSASGRSLWRQTSCYGAAGPGSALLAR